MMVMEDLGKAGCLAIEIGGVEWLAGVDAHMGVSVLAMSEIDFR
jgi:hypothetical protein